MSNNQKLSNQDIIIGGCILICAQISAASTASCVKALPEETPNILRGLWRQTLTSVIFSILTISVVVRNRCSSGSEETNDDDSEKDNLLSKPLEEDDDQFTISKERLVLVLTAVLGSTLLNDTIVIALEYASSAAVMCLCNTTPIWLIIYTVIQCGSDMPSKITIIGATISIIGAIICSTGETDEQSEHKNENLGSLIALLGAVGSAAYMTACRSLAPVGIHPIFLSLVINVGMMATTFILCHFYYFPDGMSISRSLSNGLFGWLNPKANPAAFLQSIFPDLGGNFGIMLALSYFDPLIVSMVMLTEPLNASIIAMNFVGEAPPSTRTIFGVIVVLLGCAIVLLRASKTSDELEEQKEVASSDRIRERGERSSAILFSRMNTIAPNLTPAAYNPNIIMKKYSNLRSSLPNDVIRCEMLAQENRAELEKMRTSKRSTIHKKFSSLIFLPQSSEFHRSSFLLVETQNYGSTQETDSS